jgi:hypothetical protein
VLRKDCNVGQIPVKKIVSTLYGIKKLKKRPRHNKSALQPIIIIIIIIITKYPVTGLGGL